MGDGVDYERKTSQAISSEFQRHTSNKGHPQVCLKGKIIFMHEFNWCMNDLSLFES